MNSRILLLEDDESLGQTLQERLVKEGYSVTWVQDLKSARGAVQASVFDLVVLDVGLPDGTGFEFAEEYRESFTSPFLFMTAMNTAEYRLQGYELGAEEFIPKPFHLKELLLRIAHVLKEHAPQKLLNINGVTLSFEKRSITDVAGKEEFLSKRDYELLLLLIEKSPSVVSRDEILDRVVGEDKFPSHRTVDNSIVRLRQLLLDQEGNIIRSVRGIGYQWVGNRS